MVGRLTLPTSTGQPAAVVEIKAPRATGKPILCKKHNAGKIRFLCVYLPSHSRSPSHWHLKLTPKVPQSRSTRRTSKISTELLHHQSIFVQTALNQFPKPAKRFCWQQLRGKTCCFVGFRDELKMKDAQLGKQKLQHHDSQKNYGRYTNISVACAHVTEKLELGLCIASRVVHQSTQRVLWTCCDTLSLSIPFGLAPAPGYGKGYPCCPKSTA